MTAVIDTLIYKIASETQEFRRDTAATRRELNLVKRVMQETATPAERLAANERKLEELYQRRLIDLRTYQRALAQLRAGQVQTAATTQTMSGRMNELSSAMGLNVKQFVGITGAVAAATLGYQKLRGVFAEVRQTLGEMDQQFKKAAAIDIDVNKLRAIEIAAERSGIAGDRMEMMLLRLARVSGDTINEFGEMGKKFAELGIDVDKFARLTPEDKLIEIALAIGELDDRAAQVSATAAIFESEGRELVRVFDALRDGGLQPFVDELERLGLDVGPETISKTQALVDEMDRLEARSTAFKEGFTEGLIDPLLTAAEALDSVGISARTVGQIFADTLTANMAGAVSQAKELNTAFALMQGLSGGLTTILSGGNALLAGDSGPTERPQRQAAAAPELSGAAKDMADSLKDFVELTDKLRRDQDPFRDDPGIRRGLLDNYTPEDLPPEPEAERRTATALNAAVLKGTREAIAFEQRLAIGKSKEETLLTKIEKNTRRPALPAADCRFEEVGTG